jgi:aldose 1-epimerase
MQSKIIKYIDSILKKFHSLTKLLFLSDKPPILPIMKVTREVFGLLPDHNQEASCFTAENSSGIVLRVCDYGGIIQSLRVPDRNGNPGDVVLGFDSLEGYLGEHPYIGTLVGRFANRIARGRFTLDGQDYQLTVNHGPNHLHGGRLGFDKVLWESNEFADSKAAGVSLNYFSHDKEEGYPGNLKVRVTFTLDEEDQVTLDYRATTDKPTPVNLSHHAYFNLGGGSDPVYDHELTIRAERYVVPDRDLIPTGEIRSVEGTPLDFRTPRLIGEGIGKVRGGYDHCYVLEGSGKEPEFAARVTHPASGRTMEVLTTQPGIQFYSSNFLEGISGKGGQAYGKHQALCLETQHFQDSPNHPEFPDTILRPGQIYAQSTIFKFSTR